MNFDERIFLKIVENLKDEFKKRNNIEKIRRLLVDNTDIINSLKNEGTIGKLYKAMASYDHTTAVHMKRVAFLSFKLFDFIGKSPINKHIMIQGALIHDIGKIVMPKSFLVTNLCGTENYQIMTVGHVIAGEYISRVCSLPEEISEMIALHHHHDGYPYDKLPDGFPSILSKAEWISEKGKYGDYIGLLDTIEAMTSKDREYYQKPLSPEQVQYIVEKQVKNVKIDEKIFTDFLKWFKSTVK